MVNTIPVPWYYRSVLIKTVCSHYRTYNVILRDFKHQNSTRQAQTDKARSRSWSRPDQTMHDPYDEEIIQRNNHLSVTRHKPALMNDRSNVMNAIKYDVYLRAIFTAGSANERLWMNGAALLSLSQKYNLSAAPVSGQNGRHQRRRTDRAEITSIHSAALKMREYSRRF